MTLGEVGEFRLLSEVVFGQASRHGVADGLGDDCGFFEIGSATIAASADAGPKPLVQQLPGYEDDHEAAGWHALVATASDIASAGARPLFVLDTVEAPEGLEVSALESYMSGFFGACAAFGFKALGGDLRQGAELAMNVFGVGEVEHGKRIGRRGAGAGDHIVVLGDRGAFISAFLEGRAAGGRLTSEWSRRLRFPVPQLGAMRALASHGLIKASSDSSDGLLGALENIARGSGLGFMLDLQCDMLTPDVFAAAGRAGALNPWNLFFFWGDWSMAIAVGESEWGRFLKIADTHRITYQRIGRFDRQHGRYGAILDGRAVSIRLLRNENFRSRGFRSGVTSHVEEMLTAPLFGAATSG